MLILFKIIDIVETPETADCKEITFFRSHKKKFIRYDICVKFPEIVKKYVPKKPPAITTEQGTRYLKTTLADHVKSNYHIDCLKANRLQSLENIEETPLDSMIKRSNQKMLDYIGKICIQVYNDAKWLNLSARSWPSRYVVGEASQAY